ncbi:MAG: Glyoxalase/bleomycin resistance protein/dioxygenase [Naasia sp.]|nr:Glyoxalase/bleomycin resistance protein/dioxygenase [Naasia sp.]
MSDDGNSQDARAEESEADSSARRAGSGFPIIVSNDLSKLLGFYRDVLGGRIVYQYPDDDPAFLTLKIGSATLGIGYHPDPPRGPSQMSLWFYVSDIDATIDLVRRAGIVVLEEPELQAWGERIARVLDPTGIEVILGEDEATSTARIERGAAEDGSTKAALGGENAQNDSNADDANDDRGGNELDSPSGTPLARAV